MDDKVYDVKADSGISNKTGKKYNYVECAIYTPVGVYTFRGYPSDMEFGIIRKTLGKMKEVYSGQEDSDNLL